MLAPTAGKSRSLGLKVVEFHLVGGLVAMIFIFPEILGCIHHPNWLTHIFQRGGYTTTNQSWFAMVDHQKMFSHQIMDHHGSTLVETRLKHIETIFLDPAIGHSDIVVSMQWLGWWPTKTWVDHSMYVRIYIYIYTDDYSQYMGK